MDTDGTTRTPTLLHFQPHAQPRFSNRRYVRHARSTTRGQALHCPGVYIDCARSDENQMARGSGSGADCALRSFSRRMGIPSGPLVLDRGAPQHTHTHKHTRTHAHAVPSPLPAVSPHILITFARLGRAPNDCRIALLFVRNQVAGPNSPLTYSNGVQRSYGSGHTHTHTHTHTHPCRVVLSSVLPHASLTACSAAFMSSSGTIVMPQWIGRRIALCAAVHPPPLHTHTAPTLTNESGWLRARPTTLSNAWCRRRRILREMTTRA